MPIRFPCTACGQLLGIATRKIGTEIHCPTCGLAVIVPDEEQAQLMRQQARESNQRSILAPDTPPEISIPRERQEAFDGGLESFLTQLDVAPTVHKPQAVSAPANLKAPPSKPISPTTPTPAISAKPTAATKPKNGNNGTIAVPPRPSAPLAAKPSAPPPKVSNTQPPVAAPAEEIPLVFEDHEVSVLSAADLLELADEPLAKPVPLLTAKVPAPPQPSLPAARSAVAPSSKPAAAPAKPTTLPVAKETSAPQVKSPAPPPVAKQPAAPPPAPLVAPAYPPAPEIPALVESTSPAAADFGFDFASPAVSTVTARKTEPNPQAAVAASSSTAAIPTAPFDNAVWISRRAIYTHVAILVLVSVATFLIGWISGGAGARVPGSSQAGPVRFEAQIQYVAANGKTLPDEGAVILLWPKQAKPLERLSSKRLAPSEPAPLADSPTLKAIETLHGAYARTNTQGEVRDLMLTEPGEYYVLVISRNLARPAMESINDKVIPILGDLFGGEAASLLGTRQFTLKSYLIADTRTLNHTFGAPAEKVGPAGQ